jgi:hypothetical protein
LPATIVVSMAVSLTTTPIMMMMMDHPALMLIVLALTEAQITFQNPSF